jgi:DNA-binding transcriptional regulator YiaG
MGKIETVMKSEIVRLTKKELRAVCGPVARDVRQLKRVVSGLSRMVASLNRIGREWSAKMQAEKAQLQAPEEEVKTARFSPRLIRTLRTRLGVSQAELGRLIGVSTVSVGSWESGRMRPSASKRAALVAARKLGRREVRTLLELKAASRPKPAPKKRGKRAKKK